jgi:hypothetical protein
VTTIDRRTVVTGAAAVATGGVAARLARLEAALPRARDGDPIVVVMEDRDGVRTNPGGGVIGRDTFVVVLGTRPDGPQ